MKYLNKEIDKGLRKKARKEILASANFFRLTRNPSVLPLGMRHINQAVAIVRQNLLTDDTTLENAGFNKIGGVTTHPLAKAKK